MNLEKCGVSRTVLVSLGKEYRMYLYFKGIDESDEDPNIILVDFSC